MSLAMVLAASVALARPPSGQAIPDALKDVKRSSGVCTRDSAASVHGDSGPVPEGPAPDLACAASAADVATLAARGELAFVDVRPQTAYEAFRIAGAMNMALSELRTKRVLRDKAVVLVGDGKAERELYAGCADLKQRGFKQVRVLRGGMASWLSAGRPVDGQAPEWPQLARLSASQLWTESRFEANLLLVTPDQAAMQSQLPFAMPVADDGPAAVKAVIERRRKELKGAALGAVVLVASPNTPADAWQRLARAIQPVPLLFHADTASAYAKQMAQQRAVWTAQARGPRQPGCGL